MDNILNDNLQDEQLNEPLELLNHSTCFYCNGFYGPCWNEPACETCHEFLFSEDLDLFQRTVRYPGSWFGEKDDGDSGNDEPEPEDGGPLNHVNYNNGDPASPEENSPEPPEVDVGVPQNNHVPDDVSDDSDEADADEMLQNEDDEPIGQGPINAEPFASPPRRRPSSASSSSNRPQVRLSNRLALLTTPRPEYETISNTDDMSLKIPPEIWAAIFLKLDDISLCLVSKVSRKWKAIVMDSYPNSKWEENVKLRWPLFHPIYQVADFYNVYCDFLDSVPCKLCFINTALHLPFDNFQPTRSLRSVRLQKELKWLRLDHPEGIEAVPLDALNYNWLARISGPPLSPYEGGVFYLNLKVPYDYPLKPPVVRFLSRIIHPNVSRHGDIGLDSLHWNWTLALTIPQILLSIQSLLTDPYCDTSMEPEISNLYNNDRSKFDKIARICTRKYCMIDVLVH